MTHDNEPQEPSTNRPTAARLEELAACYYPAHDGRCCRTCEVALMAQMLLAAEHMIAAIPEQVERTTVRELALLERNRRLTDALEWLARRGGMGPEAQVEINRALGVRS